MATRAKFESLTLVNWNGFFARTFELDELVTTLSGGNGAGKSTTMAAFITALIPDQTLLHFRNTTEAGSSSASRDKGLYGKLRPGHCYALIAVRNSRGQRVWHGVALQQLGSRDHKVHLQRMVLTDLPEELAPTELLVEPTGDGKAVPRSMQELRRAASELAGVRFKRCDSVTEYHNLLFELGLTPKKMRDQKDRGKYYRLIEASLYGGISSTITRSLRDYLLPENSGVRKAFADMEAAIRENRQTLNAIRATQDDRDLFKNLLTETTHYVAADYLRHQSLHQQVFQEAHRNRQACWHHRRRIREERERIRYLQNELTQLGHNETMLEEEFAIASEHLQKVLEAAKLQQKVAQYREQVEELADKLAMQQEVVGEQALALEQASERKQQSEQEVDTLKSQLADYQQALDVQQTRALQYQQACRMLAQLRQQVDEPGLTTNDVPKRVQAWQQRQQELTDQLLQAEQQATLAARSKQQFELAFQALTELSPETSRGEAWQRIQPLLDTLREQQLQAQQAPRLRQSRQQLEREVARQQQARQLAHACKEVFGELPDNEEQLEQLLQLQQEQLAEQEQQQREQQNHLSVLASKRESVIHQLSELKPRLPRWALAQDELQQLQQLTEMPLDSAEALVQAGEQLREQQEQYRHQKAQLDAQKQQLQQQIRTLAVTGGGIDPAIKAISEFVGGTPLADVYDDIALDEAPYYSALYGPARQGIVVADLDAAISQLEGLENCPEDLYLIEGNPDSFDENLFEATEIANGVWVQSGERQIRFSPLPAVPLFGRAAREQRIEQLEQQLEQIVEAYGEASFGEQKVKRAVDRFNRFIGEHLHIAFSDDLETRYEALNAEAAELEAMQQQVQGEQASVAAALQQQRDALGLLQKLQRLSGYLGEIDLEAQLAECSEQLQAAESASHYLDKHRRAVGTLEQHWRALQDDPEQLAELEQQVEALRGRLTEVRQQSFALADLESRLPHFDYADAESLLQQTNELNERLRQKLADAEQLREQCGRDYQAANQAHLQEQQVANQLGSALDARRQTLQEFATELEQTGIHITENSEGLARERREQLQQQLLSTRSRRQQATTQVQFCEKDIHSLGERLEQETKTYLAARGKLLSHKRGWVKMRRLVEQHSLGSRLARRDLAYLEEDQLRSVSDKALGALRFAVNEEETLRDALRASEDGRYPERKVEFYLAVFNYLKSRIRHDIIRSDDPVEAIEEMEIELARLADELKQREQQLSLSSRDVASKIGNIIRREQNRIRMLNQGLQNIAFGQVKGVRLKVQVRDAYRSLLHALAEQAERHQDLFDNDQLTFSEAMAKLFQRLNPHIDQGQRSQQVLGDALLDYRNYLELEIEVLRGADGWLRAESGALSTGEAIGTGQAILLMVLQSWEEDSARLRGKEMLPCRLLFLDEAARLDAKSIATLFELCERQDMQLLIAAPENISPEKGTTYKLIRKVVGKQEHVHVIGLRGFAQAVTGELARTA